MPNEFISGLRNFHNVDAHLVRSGEFLDYNRALSLLKTMGVVEVICLKHDMPPEELEAERSKVYAAGLVYTNMPLAPQGKFSYDDGAKVPAILTEIARPAGRVLVHCKVGHDRTGTVVACYRIQRGWSVDDAIKEARNLGMSFWNFGMRAYIRKFGEGK